MQSKWKKGEFYLIQVVNVQRKNDKVKTNKWARNAFSSLVTERSGSIHQVPNTFDFRYDEIVVYLSGYFSDKQLRVSIDAVISFESKVVNI